jgi:hypothetical protein
MAEIDEEYIDELRKSAEYLEGDLAHTRFVTMEDIRADILTCLPDTIITTVKLSVVMTDLMKEAWELARTRVVNEIECAEFMMLAPFVLRIAILGTDYCYDGEYIMFRDEDEGAEQTSVLVRQGIQG